MRVPFVIDNLSHRLGDVLNDLLAREAGQELDVASAYFSIRGFEVLRRTLPGVRGLRLLLGGQPQTGRDIGLAPDASAYLRNELNAEPLTRETQDLVEDLIRLLRRDGMHVRRYLGHAAGDESRDRFLHAKCYLLYGNRDSQQSLVDRFVPLVGIVGSSNFTGPGLMTNHELNLVHKTLLGDDELDDPLARREVARQAHAQAQANQRIASENRRLLKSEIGARAILDLRNWFNAQWDRTEDYKDALIELLDSSKFGQREYTPYQIYLKALYEYFRDDLDTTVALPHTQSAVELAEFQEDAVKRARRILARYDGVLIGDSVGLGKTWIGKKLSEDRAYHLRQKALVVCPAALRRMWESELQSASIAARVLTQESLG